MKGYLRLKQRDIIQNGDEVFAPWGTWLAVSAKYVGKKKGALCGCHVKMRRKNATEEDDKD